jgi:hypothetical protein
MITDKADLDFREWYNSHMQTIEYTTDEDGNKELYKIWYDQFREHPITMQYGLIVLFANSKGYSVYVNPNHAQGKWSFSISTKKDNFRSSLNVGIEQSMRSAIVKFNELYNTVDPEL